MNRLVLRFKKGGCLSTDMVGEKWEPALAELLHRKELLFSDKEIDRVEMMIYQPEYIYRFRARPVKVDLATFKYVPEEPVEEEKLAPKPARKPKAAAKGDKSDKTKPKRTRKTTVATDNVVKA